MDVYEYLYSEKTTSMDFLDTLSEFFKNTNLNPHSPFSEIENGVTFNMYGTQKYAVKSVLNTIKEGVDMGLEVFVTDALSREEVAVSDDTESFRGEYINVLKEYSAISLYKYLRGFTTKHIASRATLLVLTQYVRSLDRR